MEDVTGSARRPDEDAAAHGYQPPTITYLGSIADLTRSKQVGAADGTQFLGIDLGTV